MSARQSRKCFHGRKLRVEPLECRRLLAVMADSAAGVDARLEAVVESTGLECELVMECQAPLLEEPRAVTMVAMESWEDLSIEPAWAEFETAFPVRGPFLESPSEKGNPYLITDWIGDVDDNQVLDPAVADDAGGEDVGEQVADPDVVDVPQQDDQDSGETGSESNGDLEWVDVEGSGPMLDTIPPVATEEPPAALPEGEVVDEVGDPVIVTMLPVDGEIMDREVTEVPAAEVDGPMVVTDVEGDGADAAEKPVESPTGQVEKPVLVTIGNDVMSDGDSGGAETAGPEVQAGPLVTASLPWQRGHRSRSVRAGQRAAHIRNDASLLAIVDRDERSQSAASQDSDSVKPFQLPERIEMPSLDMPILKRLSRFIGRLGARR
jgi:hypothetical protein